MTTISITNKLTLNTNDIDIWQITPSLVDEQRLLSGDTLFSHYHQMLSEDEVAKYQRYKFANDQRNGLITRAFVRCVLSHYAELAPHEWQFVRGEKGRPAIANKDVTLNFNLSHTKDLIVCAVTPTLDVGIDVEFGERRNDILKIADRYFSPNEVKELFSLPEAQQKARFFDYWTLKEAYIKAWGLGLAIPLKDFSFAINDKQRTLRPANDGSANGCSLNNSAVNDKLAADNNLNGDKFFGDIDISFADHREDNPELWRHWLMSPTNKHRLALSVRATENNQSQQYTIRRFDYIPGIEVREI